MTIGLSLIDAEEFRPDLFAVLPRSHPTLLAESTYEMAGVCEPTQLRNLSDIEVTAL